MSSSLPIAGILSTLAVVWAAAWVDFKTFRIPNALSVTVAAMGLLSQVWGLGLAGIWQGIAGLGLGLALLLPAYLLGHAGAGDVKLMGAVGALLGPQRLWWALLFSILAAGVMGAMYATAAWRTRGASGPWRRYGRMLRVLWVTGRPGYVPPAPGEAMAERMPVAVPIAIGTTAATFTEAISWAQSLLRI